MNVLHVRGNEDTPDDTPQQHHQRAAEHHALASKHHKQASLQFEAGNHNSAAHHAVIAHAHTLHAVEQAAQASKKYLTTQALSK